MSPTDYLAIVSPGARRPGIDKDRLASISALTGMSAMHQCPGLTLFCRSQDHIREDGAGAMVGTVFHRDARLVRLEPHSTNRPRPFASSADRSALWGKYIRFRSEHGGRRIVIIRDPSALIPCYYRQRQGEWLVSSSARLLFVVDGETPSIDWSQLAHFLAFPNLRNAQSCLFGVMELPGGFELRVEEKRLEAIGVWSPWSFAARDSQIMNSADAVAALRDTVFRVVGALSSGHDHLLLSLSGGLDSSIVAAALAATGARCTALNLSTSEAKGDERRYAGLVADACRIPIRYAREDVECVDWARSDGWHLPRPTARVFSQSSDRAHRAVAQEIGASGFISGGGGDSVFCYYRSCTPLIDHFRAGARASDLWRTARDLALFGEISLPALLGQTARRAARRDNRYQWRGNLELIAQDWREAVAPPDHPWGPPPPDICPGKVLHVAWLQQIQNYLEGYGRERDHVIEWPLLSQPVVELCLRIPSWMWFQGGRNRAVARDAFQGLLPAAILDRRTKGTPQSLLIQIFLRHRRAILASLQDGLLAQHNLLDVAALDTVAHADEAVAFRAYRRLLALSDVESWARSWVAGHDA